MRKLMVVLVSMLVIPTGNLYGVLYVDISNPGETVVQTGKSLPCASILRLDQYRLARLLGGDECKRHTTL